MTIYELFVILHSLLYIIYTNTSIIIGGGHFFCSSEIRTGISGGIRNIYRPHGKDTCCCRCETNLLQSTSCPPYTEKEIRGRIGETAGGGDGRTSSVCRVGSANRTHCKGRQVNSNMWGLQVTVNQTVKLDNYPIPKAEDLFATLNGGDKFIKLDMSQAYQQIPLEDQKEVYHN